MVIDKFKLDNKVGIITGGAGFLGVKHAEAVIEAGGIPVVADIDAGAAEETANTLRIRYSREAVGVQMDVSSEESIVSVKEKLLRKFAGIDFLINNAAIDPKVKNNPDGLPWSRFELFPEEEWELEIKVGLKGAFLCSRIIGQHMVEHGGGVILNISSDLGLIAPDQRIYKKDGLPEEAQPVKPVTYSVIKHGLIGLTRYLSTYWADKNVRVNALCPGGVYNNQPEAFVRRLTSLIPLGRMADRDEYKAAVVFLLSEASSYMTGSVVVMDGGRTAW